MLLDCGAESRALPPGGQALSNAAIKVEGLSKRYRIGQPVTLGLLRDALANLAAAPLRRLRGRGARAGQRGLDETDGRYIWALRDVSFDVQPGEIVGIIGSNGAGKSTLLKLLARITYPTEGVAEIAGRVVALMEVGTGFHPELTGRENVYLNGAVLGMSRSEVARKFDEIVAFAGVERFIDTPVKRYSTGMQMRLAFAVAAHLETEILMVDEVLAVGDAAFQLKCLTKMSQVSTSGRTVLFVSHNLETVRQLCRRAILLEQGRIAHIGATQECIDRYMSVARRQRRLGQGTLALTDHAGRTKEFNAPLRLTTFRVEDEGGRATGAVASGGALRATIGYQVAPGARMENVRFSLVFSNMRNHRLAACRSHDTLLRPISLQGSGSVSCHIPRLPLVPGTYSLTLMCAGEVGYLDVVYDAAVIEVTGNGFYPSGYIPGADEGEALFDHQWEVNDARHPVGDAVHSA